jgi:ComF family protein
MFKALRDSLLSVVFPQECLACAGPVESQANGVACDQCWSTTRFFNGDQDLCSKCGAFLGDTKSDRAIACRNCDGHHYDKAAAAGVYEKALAASIIHLKTNPVLSSQTASMFIDAFDLSGFISTTLIIPVPLSKLRNFERGHNQAEILAKTLSDARGLPVDRNSLVRTIDTPMHRVAMDMKARESTVRNAFDVRRPRMVEGHNILLVDDVFTSGSTSSYCAKVLKKNGANIVNVLTLARAILV